MASRRFLLGLVAVSLVAWNVAFTAAGESKVTRFVRFQSGDTVAYGILEGDQVRQLTGDLFGKWEPSQKTFALKDVTLLVPTQPAHVFAMAGNYKSHLGDAETTTTTITTTTKIITNKKTGERSVDSQTTTESRSSGQVPDLFKIPQPFFKSPASLVRHGGKIVIPHGAEVVHYEAEMVVVIGKKASNVSKEDALDYVLGVTCGNDVSARLWQKGDVQWWRAKASDTFGPCGPVIASGLDYDNLQMQLRLNNEVKQNENTKYLIHDVASTVAFISQHVTLQPGDLIFTGTPGKTSEIRPGDTVEVEIEGVGVLRNEVVAEQ